MLLPHHWLGFALLAVLIFPAWTAPPPPPPEQSLIEYKVTVVNEDGVAKDKVPASVCARIRQLIIALGPELGDREGAEWKEIECVNLDAQGTMSNDVNTAEMVYFEFSGGKSCTERQKCHGYVVTIKVFREDSRVGAVLVQKSLNSFIVFDRILARSKQPSKEAIKIHRQKYDEFLNGRKEGVTELRISRGFKKGSAPWDALGTILRSDSGVLGGITVDEPRSLPPLSTLNLLPYQPQPQDAGRRHRLRNPLRPSYLIPSSSSSSRRPPPGRGAGRPRQPQ
ncbi:hypothetical protein BDP27DRAFT_1445099 [Rhodocollybia butyracea]|uniref:Uncharacterized protein n=1 Tax=Rhodocollybia butyracea TaxID=206335 RepID=A0A9P5Q1K6_9AGAR|nr:hypothetical protein BDP27DRAFT_1445099 [Rhodocollybia butyracea]